jgi:hypothetical protein
MNYQEAHESRFVGFLLFWSLSGRFGRGSAPSRSHGQRLFLSLGRPKSGLAPEKWPTLAS